ncbi:Tax1-binding protein 3 [Halotydeus destructor]|nr:Tax1-binding protein 3 [Halotydeus destructor]
MSTFQHEPGTVIECLSIPIKLTKEVSYDPNGQQALKCGFKIGGGIDQDYTKSPQGFTDNGIYVTDISGESPATRSGLRLGDKILQCNGYDFTIVTHRKAVEYIKKDPVLNLLIARRGVT